MPNRVLRNRIAGQSAMADVARLQAGHTRTFAQRLFGLHPLAPAARAPYRVALGELVVGDILKNLGTRWDVLHELPVGDARIEHLATGPTGVYAIVSMNLRGLDVHVTGEQITVDGIEVATARGALDLAARASERLSAAMGRAVEVRPLVVIIEPRKLVGDGVGALVVRSNDLLRTLARAGATLDGETVAAISDVADHVETWQTVPVSPPEECTLHSGFERVRIHVRAARRRQLLWVLAVAGACVLVWGVVTVIVAVALS